MLDQGQEKHAKNIPLTEVLKYVDVEKVALMFIKENLGLLVKDMPAWKDDSGICVDKRVTKESILEAIAAQLQ